MQIVWDNLYSSVTPIDLSNATSCVDIMKQTALVHRNRDFLYYTPAQLTTKVNVPVNGYNWIKIRSGHDADQSSAPKVYIIYHLLRHRIRQHMQGQWSLSIGFDQKLLPAPSGGNVNDPKNPYVQFAEAIGARMAADLKSISPNDGYSVIYDDIGGDAGFGNEGTRRATPIGELGWVCQKSSLVQGVYFGISGPVLEPCPVDGLGYRIPGWGRPQDTQIVVTTLQTL